MCPALAAPARLPHHAPRGAGQGWGAVREGLMKSWILPALLACAQAAPVRAQAVAEPLVARSLAATCANCHGTNGQARGAMAPLAGRPAEALRQQLADFRRGAVPGTVMPQIARGYSDEQLALIAAYFARQPAARTVP